MQRGTMLSSRGSKRKKGGVTSRATTPLGRGATLNSGGSVLRIWQVSLYPVPAVDRDRSRWTYDAAFLQ